jgi:phosphoglycolate phosphatase
VKVEALIRGILFDWDGTLLNSYQADLHAYLQMFRALGINWGVAELNRHYSPNWHHVYRAAGIPRRRWKEADGLWARHYDRQRPRLLPGARRVLRALGSRYTLGLVTSGNRARVVRQLRFFRLTSVFSARVCAEDAAHRKPHPAPLREALRRLRLPPAACLYVGDAAEDMEMARRARVRGVAVLGPFPTHDRLRAAGPLALLDSIRELPQFLEALPSAA